MGFASLYPSYDGLARGEKESTDAKPRSQAGPEDGESTCETHRATTSGGDGFRFALPILRATSCRPSSNDGGRLRQLTSPDHVRGLVGDHHGRGVEIGGDHAWHDRGVDHAEVL
jgi:hypothetical protein